MAQIGRFFCVFLLVILVYSVAFTSAFGADIAENRNLFSSAVELMKVFALGSKHFDRITVVNEVLGPLLFLTFQVGCGFIVFGIPGAILNKTYRHIASAGVDDPVAKEFRQVMHKAVDRFKKYLYYMGKKDESERFRLEREREFEDIFSVAERQEADDKAATNKELVRQMAQQLQAVSASLRAVTDKADTVKRHQDKLHAKDVKPEVVKTNLIFGRRVAWSANASGEITEELAGCVPVAGNKSVIPPNWRKHLADDGTVFYHNRDTGKTQWDPPVVYHAAVPPDEENDKAARTGSADTQDDGAGVF